MNPLRPVLLLTLLLAAGCHAGDEAPTAMNPANAPVPDSGATATSSELPLLVVHKTPWCGCCTAWAEQAEAAGFAVEMRDHDDLAPIKQAMGVPLAQASCHTAEIDGYFIEGHVPFEQVHRLLDERPTDVAGIAVPGMPLGSPGMEADVQHDYDVNLVGKDGTVSRYASYPAD